MILKSIFGHKGLLGINARNLLYIRPYNKKKAIKLADDKIKTKQFLAAREIPVPKLYNIIKTPEDLAKFDFNSLPQTFVIKPNNGFGGEGIIPIVKKDGNSWIGASGNKYTKADLEDHIHDVLDGRFSISNVGDYAFFEQYIVADNIIGKFAYEGLPDIRVVVHNLIPVMAMLRLPTKESGGKANVHQGACAVGIDIAKGECTYIAYKGKIVDELPNGLGKIRGVKIPFWDEILLIASKVQLITNLGYLAADICLDKNSGPVLLEINARAGLQVQVANLAPLRRRLERIEGVKVTTPQKGVRIAKDMFGNTVEKEIEHLSGKQIIGTEEEIEIIKQKGTFRLLAKIDTSKSRSIIDEEVADKNELLENTQNYNDEKSILKMKFSIKNQRIQTVADVEKIPSEKYKFIIGKRDLKDFLIDTAAMEKDETRKSKKIPKIKVIKTKINNFSQIDQSLCYIDSKLKLLYHLRPINLESEQNKFLRNSHNDPVFEYPKLKFDPLELIDQLSKIEPDNSPLGILFQKKKEEIENKIALLEAIDEERFTEISKKLFGSPSKEDLENCLQALKSTEHERTEEKTLYGAEEAKEKFENCFESYGLNNWKVKIKEEMVSDCVAGKNNRLFVKKDARFSLERIESLIVHEIETHIITAENGKIQSYELFNRGHANYLPTQEGLAMYNVEKQRHIPFSKNQRAHALVVAMEIALKSSFTNTYNELLKHNFEAKQAFRTTMKLKRGLSDTSKSGAFTKDVIYYKGYQKIKDFVGTGGNLKDLYIGKFDLDDLGTIKKIPGVREAKILPTWL